MYKLYIFLVAGFFACHSVNNLPDPSLPPVAKEVKPEIKLSDLKDNRINLENYKGKAVFINFWATWCKPCIEEMPSIQKAQALFNDNEVIFLLASSESIEEINSFSRNHKYPFNFVHLENAETLNLQALPTTFIINPKGILVFSEMGSRNWDEPSNIDLIKNITKQHD